MYEFTLRQYNDFLVLLEEGGYESRWFGDYRPGGPAVWIRHDVDYSLLRARKMLEVDARHRFKATYFMRQWFFDALQARRAGALAFQKQVQASSNIRLGYHYEFNEGEQPISVKIRTEAICRNHDLYAISAHGNPFRRDGRYLLGNLDIAHNVYLVPKTCGLYLSDTGRLYLGANLYDWCALIRPMVENYRTSTITRLMTHLRRDRPNMVINFHPDRWTDDWVEWHRIWLSDKIKNTVKRCIRIIRAVRSY